MPRIPLPELSELSAPVSEALSVMPPQGTIFRMVAHAETAFSPFLQLAGVIQTGLSLDPVLRQIAILRVSVIARCPYETVQQEVVSKIEGVPEAKVRALVEGRIDGAGFTDRELLLLRFVDEVIEQRGAGEATTAAMAAIFSPREIVEILLVVWQYFGIAMLINTTGLETQPPIDAEAILKARARRAALLG